MPKFPKSFGRRKSTANVLEDVENLPPKQSFKVFERPGGTSKSFDGGVNLAKVLPKRPLTSPMNNEDNMFEDIKGNRGSGASNTNTVSTTEDSIRLSGASTAPSSTHDLQGQEDWGSPHDKPFNDIPLPPIPKSSSTFSLKNAGRTLSWGRTKTSSATLSPSNGLDQSSSRPVEEDASSGRAGAPIAPIVVEPSAGRARAVTASSYASTATPPKVDEKGLNLGGDFLQMFSGLGKRASRVLDTENNKAMSESPDSLPSGPAMRSYSSNRLNQPPPIEINKSKEVEAAPYSWSSQRSHDGLITNSSPVPFAPRNGTSVPPVPQHGSPQTIDENPSIVRPQRSGGPAETGLRQSSGFSAKRRSTLEYGEPKDEDAELLRESMDASRRLNNPSPNTRVRDSWAVPSSIPSSNVDHAAVISSWGLGSTEATPRANRVQPQIKEENLFNGHVNLSQEQFSSASTNHSAQNKVMTPAEFEKYKQDQEKWRSVAARDDDEDETYEDEEDEAERNRQLAKQRRKQEAHMAVYRQQMMKVTGETQSSRPSIFATQSTPNLLTHGQAEDGEEEDEEVPLAILQAHGFPNKNKPPMQSLGSNPNLRASAQMGAGGESSGRLPVFARNLPQDPYIGASLVHPTNRESMAFGGGGAGSVHDGSSRSLPPGGLVGVIANEERSRAMRRGSPNMQEYGSPPSNGFNGTGFLSMGGSTATDSIQNGMGPMVPINPMVLTPGDQATIEMSHQMQQFMQMQMHFMQMMAAGQGPPQQNGHMGQRSFGGIPVGPPNQNTRPGSSHQRPMTMLDPNSSWMQQGQRNSSIMNGPAGGYAPSIAPSERSNIGLPGRYRPVSQLPTMASKLRTSTMSGAIQGWDEKNVSTVKVVKKSADVSDEDDEEGWSKMMEKRNKKKSLWKNKKEELPTNGLEGILNFSP